MQTITLALVLLSAVLISAVIAQIVPKVSSPLVQIALGALVAIIADSRIIIEIEPELFLVLFIAPLLFHEAHEADKTSLWKNKKSMLSYAIGLVLLSAIVIGVAVHALIPSIGLLQHSRLVRRLGQPMRLLCHRLNMMLTFRHVSRPFCKVNRSSMTQVVSCAFSLPLAWLLVVYL